MFFQGDRGAGEVFIDVLVAWLEVNRSPLVAQVRPGVLSAHGVGGCLGHLVRHLLPALDSRVDQLPCLLHSLGDIT